VQLKSIDTYDVKKTQFFDTLICSMKSINTIKNNKEFFDTLICSMKSINTIKNNKEIFY
jgi:hypothetical protein